MTNQDDNCVEELWLFVACFLKSKKNQGSLIIGLNFIVSILLKKQTHKEEKIKQ